MKFTVFLLTFLKGLFGYAQNQQTNVLFIGNSFTHMHNMPKIFEHLATSKGKTVFADSIAVSGSSLKAHSERPSTYKKLKSKKWDYVFIQGYSKEFCKELDTIRANTIPYVQQILDSLKKKSPCAQVIFYMTWAYEIGEPTEPENDTYEKMQLRIQDGYKMISDSLGYPIAPVGMVWRELRKINPKMDLYDADRYHPSPLGSYTAACTFFSSIYKESPVGGTAPKEVDSIYWNEIQKTAAKIVFGQFSEFKLDQLRKTSPNVAASFSSKVTWLSAQFTSKYYKTAKYKWEFGDGKTSRLRNPKYYYKSNGTYTVTLRMTIDCNEYAVKKIVTVSNKVKDPNAKKTTTKTTTTKTTTKKTITPKKTAKKTVKAKPTKK